MEQAAPSIPESSEKGENSEGLCALCGAYAPSQLVPIPDTETQVCAACHVRIHHYPFPQWVKTFYGIVVLFVLGGAIYNARFVTAYWDVTRARVAWARGDIETAAERYASASTRVPEARDLQGLEQMFHAFVLLRDEKDVEAERLLQSAKSSLPANPTLDLALEAARLGAAFERKDYDGFLKLAQERLEKSHDPGALLQVASAFACKFATTGDESYRTAAINHLDQGAASHARTPALLESEQRIRYRLSSREIISAREFHRRYPNGWQEEK